MSDETKEKIGSVMLSGYRWMTLTLLSIVAVFVGRIYMVIMEDHDMNIRQETRINAIELKQDKLDNLKEAFIELNTKFTRYEKPQYQAEN